MVRLALARVAGVHLDDLTRLGILQHQPAERGQLQFVAVQDLNRDDIMPAIRLFQGVERRLEDGFGEQHLLLLHAA